MLARCRAIWLGLVVPMSLLAAPWSEDLHGWVFGEGLLLRPTVPDNYYTINGPLALSSAGIIPVGAHVTYCPSYRWGYRIEVGLRMCKTDLRIDWTSYHTTQRASSRARPDDVIWPELSAELTDNDFAYLGGLARIADAHQYGALDGDVGQWFCPQCGCLALRVFAGLRYVRFEVNRVAQYITSEDRLDQVVKQLSDTQGIGPRLGMYADYSLPCGFHLVGRVGGALLIGSSKGRFFSNDANSTGFAPTDIRNSTSCEILPCADLKFGLGWAACVCRVTLRGDVGYQLTHYNRGVQRTRMLGGSASSIGRIGTASNVTLSKPYTLDGWYFSLGAEY